MASLGGRMPRRGRIVCGSAYAVVAAGSVASLALLDHRPSTAAGWLLPFLALLAVSAAADALRARQPSWLGSFDASFVVGLCGLVLVGPLGAMVTLVVPDLVARMAGRRRRVWINTLGTTAALAAECLVGAGILTAAPSLSAVSALPTLFTAGLAMAATSFLVGPALFALVHERLGVAPSLRPFAAALPLEAGLAALGALVALATAAFGVLPLIVFAAAVELPRLVLGELSRFADVGEASPDDARRVYAQAMADVLALPRTERQLLDQGLDIMAGRTPERLSAPVVELTEAILHRDERWDGDGDPAGLSGDWIPRVARILAVADAWSAVTARGTARLPHDEALLGLATGAGTRFDPGVVDAATAVVAAEAPYAKQEAFLPRLHRAPLPRSLRRNTLPRVLGAVVAE